MEMDHFSGWRSSVSQVANMMIYRAFILLLVTFSLLACGDEPPVSSTRPRSAVAPLVEVATVVREDVALQVERNGHLRSEQSFKVINQEEGVIMALPYHPGDLVQKGEILLQLDDRVLRAELQRASALRRQAEQDLTRMERLEGQSAVSDDELAQSRTALAVARAEESVLRLRLARTSVVVPFSGRVTERLAEPGDALARHQHVMTVIDTEALLVDVTVAAEILTKVARGDRVTVTIDALGTERHVGQILRIYPAIDAASGQGRIEVALDGLPEGAMPGQLVRVGLEVLSPQQLTVPYSALQEDEQGSYVLLVDGEGKVRREPVVVVLQYGERVSLQGALEPGMQVVTKGFVGIRGGSSVAVVGGQEQP